MSELKEVMMVMQVSGERIPSGYYKKSEVDKVIENIVKGAVSMFRESSCCRGLDLKSPLGRIADAAFKHWNRVELTLSNNRQLRLENENLHLQLKSQMSARLTDKIEYAINIRYQKYRRCLAMASNCRLRARWFGDNAFYKKEQWALQWHRRWLELAERLKEAK